MHARRFDKLFMNPCKHAPVARPRLVQAAILSFALHIKRNAVTQKLKVRGLHGMRSARNHAHVSNTHISKKDDVAPTHIAPYIPHITEALYRQMCTVSKAS